MPYSESEARSLIIEAGHRLVSEKLIARTWGNISARISDSQFIITPSGMAYETLKEEDLVVVDIADCSWSGDNKPSSEKGIHASAYSLRKDVNFIIHTHQVYASAISVLGVGFEFAPCASYGLPGTATLKKAVTDVVSSNPSKKAFLMKNHGALCLGVDYEDAFKEASGLENNSLSEYKKRVANIKEKSDKRPYLDDYAQIMGPFGKNPGNEDKETIDLITFKNSVAARFAGYEKHMNLFDSILQNFVYKKKYSKLKGVRI